MKYLPSSWNRRCYLIWIAYSGKYVWIWMERDTRMEIGVEFLLIFFGLSELGMKFFFGEEIHFQISHGKKF